VVQEDEHFYTVCRKVEGHALRADLVRRIGMLRVDAGTGELLTDPQTEQEMLRHAEQSAQGTTLPAGT